MKSNIEIDPQMNRVRPLYGLVNIHFQMGIVSNPIFAVRALAIVEAHKRAVLAKLHDGLLSVHIPRAQNLLLRRLLARAKNECRRQANQ